MQVKWSPQNWTRDTRPIATQNRQLDSWIHTTGATLTVRRVAESQFEVASYPEQIAEYTGFVDISQQFTRKKAALSHAHQKMIEIDTEHQRNS